MANSTENVKHKPSKKVVLEDVLTSLQDLVNNEFADDFADAPRSRETESAPNVLKKGGAAKAAGLRKRGRPRKHPLPSESPKAPEPVRKVAAQPVEQKDTSEDDDYTYSQEQADLFGDRPAVAKSVKKAGKLPGKKVLRPDRPAKSAKQNPVAENISRPKLETPHEQTNLKVVGGDETAKQQKTKQDDMAIKPSNTAKHLEPDTSAANASLDWADDIPVLTEEVDPQTLGMRQLQDVVDRSLERKDLAPEAREIAVKVAAKLNIEMRESGKQLDIKTIMRLQALLKEALEPKD